jgi:hypothetical protein
MSDPTKSIQSEYIQIPQPHTHSKLKSQCMYKYLIQKCNDALNTVSLAMNECARG